MSQQIYTTVHKLLVERFGVEAASIRPDMGLQEIGLDSLSLMEFVFAVEDAFDLRIPEERLDPRQSGVTLQLVCDTIAALKAPQAPSGAFQPAAA